MTLRSLLFVILSLSLCTTVIVLLSVSVTKLLADLDQDRVVKRNPRPRQCHGCFNAEFPMIVDQPLICAASPGQTVDIILFILSSPEDYERRRVLRKTWVSVTRNNTSNFRHVFVLGVCDDPLRMRDVYEESGRFRDIIVSSFHDVYTNLTLKTMTSLRWLIMRCPHARFFFKTDVDVWLNTRSLLQTFNRNAVPLQEGVGGFCQMGHEVIRSPSTAKWSSSYESYPEDQYPDYCSGTGYGSSLKVAKQLVAVSKDVPFFHLEDVYIGLCLQLLKLKVVHLEGFLMRHVWDPCYWHTDMVVTLHEVTPERMLKLWYQECGEDYSKYHRRKNLLLDFLFLVQ